MKKQLGFTLLELIVTIGILSVVLVVGMRMTSQNMVKNKDAQNTAGIIISNLTVLQNAALSRSTTSRLVVTDNGNNTYTFATYTSSAPTTTCTSGGGTWTLITPATVITVNRQYQITGTSLANTCFYRDGSSSGGEFTVSPLVADATTKTTTITITVATGFLDVVVD